MRYARCIVCLLLLAACNPNTSGQSSDNPFNSVEEVRDEIIPLAADAIHLSTDTQKYSSIDQTTTTISYTTTYSVDIVEDQYRNFFKWRNWEPYPMGGGFPDLQPNEFIFGKLGRDGYSYGDRIFYRNIIISISMCEDKTCVVIKDSANRRITEPFN
ncbi:MAG TPA: hypothetical protein VD886_08130 [Herpetosiphonaceae bacterium]|nr:hypothetical protein [Herpetosiphonaceae bacterium]